MQCTFIARTCVYTGFICRFLACSHFTDYDKTHLIINSVVLAVSLIAKFPEMHLVRIFGINKGNIDEDRD